MLNINQYTPGSSNAISLTHSSVSRGGSCPSVVILLVASAPSFSLCDRFLVLNHVSYNICCNSCFSDGILTDIIEHLTWTSQGKSLRRTIIFIFLKDKQNLAIEWEDKERVWFGIMSRFLVWECRWIMLPFVKRGRRSRTSLGMGDANAEFEAFVECLRIDVQ